MSKMTEEILTACAIIVAVLAVAWSVATILERTYYSGYDGGWNDGMAYAESWGWR